jgi:hypothetical protein
LKVTVLEKSAMTFTDMQTGKVEFARTEEFADQEDLAELAKLL